MERISFRVAALSVLKCRVMVQLSKKETEILRFIRTSRHKTTVDEIARALALPDSEVEVFLRGMVGQKLINVASGTAGSADSFYTNPEKREEIYDLLG
jgi:hypothetical protein